MQQLRSRTSFILVDGKKEKVIIWHGCRSLKQKKLIAKQIAKKITSKKALELGLEDTDDVVVEEIEEGQENDDFLESVGRNYKDYVSAIGQDLEESDYTIRLFNLNSISGAFKATEVVCPHRSQFSSPYPFSQNELYSASQPGEFF